MSSVSEEHYESERSCEELEEPPKFTKITKRIRTSSSDSEHSDQSDQSDQSAHSEHSDESKYSSPAKTSNVTVSARSPVDSELSNSESDSSVRKNQKPITQKHSATLAVKHNSGNESDSSVGSIAICKVKEEKESSSDEASIKSNSSSSSSEASIKSESSSGNTSNKKFKKIDKPRRKSDTFDEDSETHNVKQDSSPGSSSEDGGSASNSSSLKQNKKLSKLFSLIDCEERNSSKSCDTNQGNGRKDDQPEDKDDPIEVEGAYSFSEGNLIEFSSGVIDLEALTDSDIWLIHSPKMLSDEDLKGAYLNFSSGTHHKIGEQKYQVSSYPEEGVVACVLPSKKAREYCIAGLAVKGSAIFEESVKLPKLRKPQFTSEDGVQFPKNLKVRHPLFGADYEERISKVPESKHRVKPSKKRKSKGKERIENGYERVASSIPLDSQLTKSPKKDKIRGSVSDSHSVTLKSKSERRGSVSETNGLVNNESSSKSPKKRKRGKVEDDSVNIELAAESPIKKRKVIKSEDDFEPNDSVASSKRKKRKIEHSEESSYETPLRNKSSKKSSLDDTFMKTIGNIKEEVLSSSEMSFEGEKRKKKKKKSQSGS